MNDEICYLKMTKGILFRADLARHLVFNGGIYACGSDVYKLYFKDWRNGESVVITERGAVTDDGAFPMMVWRSKKGIEKRMKGTIFTQLSGGRLVYEIIRFDHEAHNYFHIRYSKSGGNVILLAQWSEKFNASQWELM